MNPTPWIILGVIILALFAFKKMSSVPAARARDLLQQGAKVVDVRSLDEFNSGHLPDALNVPLQDLDRAAPYALPDKEQPLLLHCLSGTRSAMAKRQLRQLGYKNVHNLGSYRRAQKILKP